jgi:hypothetical protein
MSTQRYSHHTYSTDLLPRALVVEDLPHDLLTGLRNVADPDANAFVEDFMLTPAPADCERI